VYGGGVLLLLIALIVIPHGASRLESFGQISNDASIYNRILVAQAGLRSLWDMPWGVGGDFERIFNGWYTQDRLQGIYLSVINTYLDVFVKYGYVAGFLFVAVTAYVAIVTACNYDRRPTGAVIICLCAASLWTNLANAPLIAIPFCLLMLMWIWRNARSTPPVHIMRAAVASVAVAICCSVFLILSSHVYANTAAWRITKISTGGPSAYVAQQDVPTKKALIVVLTSDHSAQHPGKIIRFTGRPLVSDGYMVITAHVASVADVDSICRAMQSAFPDKTIIASGYGESAGLMLEATHARADMPCMVLVDPVRVPSKHATGNTARVVVVENTSRHLKSEWITAFGDAVQVVTIDDAGKRVDQCIAAGVAEALSSQE